jgi:hypothetical protein
LLAERKGQEAAAEFQKILDAKVQTWGPSYPFALVGVARGAAIAGDTSRARKRYEEFFALWKEAEADIPLLVEARKEYAALQAGQPVNLPQIVPPGLPCPQPVTVPPSGNVGPGVTGTWVTDAAFPNTTLTFTAEGTTLTGSITICRGTVPLYDGTIAGAVITFKAKSLDGQRILTVTGKASGSEIVFTREVEVLPGGNSGPPNLFGANAPKTFTAKRVDAQPAR